MYVDHSGLVFITRNGKKVDLRQLARTFAKESGQTDVMYNDLVNSDMINRIILVSMLILGFFNHFHAISFNE
ncbi:MAG: hypothetical protein P0S95_04685 [Rhabdochlamydiaceae bacterium]|nr:hypothetical protein [Candidatus Amphrikana amoebophyrae]